MGGWGCETCRLPTNDIVWLLCAVVVTLRVLYRAAVLVLAQGPFRVRAEIVTEDCIIHAVLQPALFFAGLRTLHWPCHAVKHFARAQLQTALDLRRHMQ